MNLIIPNNIFTILFLFTLKGKNEPNIFVKDSSVISKELFCNKNCVALIPSMDLLSSKELFVSKKFGISFESPLSNSYLYFPSSGDRIKTLLLKGDVSSNEVILSKIIFKERFNLDVKIALDLKTELDLKNTYLICGNENWNNELYKKGTSFAEQVMEITNFPYLNYILVSENEELLKEFNEKYEKLNEKLQQNIDEYFTKVNLSKGVAEFIKEEINSLNFDITLEDSESLKETVQFSYFHRIIDDLFDIKFI